MGYAQHKVMCEYGRHQPLSQDEWGKPSDEPGPQNEYATTVRPPLPDQFGQPKTILS